MLMDYPTARGVGNADDEVGDTAIGRAAVKGAVTGYFIVVALIAGILLVAGAGLAPALAVGAFVGVWGGPGWGGMVAAQRKADRIAEDERKANSRTVTSCDASVP